MYQWAGVFSAYCPERLLAVYPDKNKYRTGT